MRVAVIMGGRSSEREVSLRTGQQVSQALRSRGHEVAEFDVDENLVENLKKAGVDVAYIALHGKYGEDGTMQGLLELMGIPYVGSGVLASALGMDKVMAKKLFRYDGITTPADFVVNKEDLERQDQASLTKKILEKVGLPMVVKPNASGSTVGVTIVHNQNELWGALKEAFRYDESVLVEEYIKGTEITATVIGNSRPKVYPLIEIVPKTAFYDYEAKYTKGMSEHIIPPRLPEEQQAKAKELALRAYQSLGCRGFARVDLIVRSTDGKPYVLEVNTLPGMTETSLVPDAARAEGISFPDLVEMLLRLATGRES
ncbi:MAG: D-alanine--D-alanine ligase [Syntrophothermus sp.]